MKKITILIFLLSYATANFAQKNIIAGTFTLQGKINGINSGSIILTRILIDRDYKNDTVKIENGEFVFKGFLHEPLKAIITVDDDQSTSFYLEPKMMKVELTKGKFDNVKLTGSKTQDEYEEFENLQSSLNRSMSSFSDTCQSLYARLQNIKDSIVRKKVDKQYIIAEKKVLQITKQLDIIRQKFVQTHPNSFLSPYLLEAYARNETIPLDTLKFFFNGLSQSVQTGIGGQNIGQIIDKRTKNLPGAKAPDFKALDMNNKIVTLSQFRGKVVIMEFWASWCAPCREGIKHLKSVYKTYHPKGLEVIAVTSDYTKKPWIAAILKDSTEMWYQIPIAEKYAEGKYTEDDVIQNYFIQRIPVQIVIDRSGNIISRTISHSKWKDNLLDKQLKKIFD